MFNIDFVHIRYDVNGKYNVIAETVRERAIQCKFSNINAANLFLGFVVYPFVNMELSIFENETSVQEEYFFNKDKKQNLCEKRFYDLGHTDKMREQRKQIIKNLIQNIRK